MRGRLGLFGVVRCHRFGTERESSKHHMPLLAGGMTYLYLGIAILSEVAATTFLKLSDGFSKPLPSLVTVAGYAVAFYFLSLTLRGLPTGVVYAVWSGVGAGLTAPIAWGFQSRKLDRAALSGRALSVSGGVVINLLSNASSQ